MFAFKSKKNLVYEKLKKRIIHHSLRPGEPLDESALTKELKISKTPIREAFQQLEVEGFIENIPGRGRFVSQISVQDIKELFEIREILECEVIKRVAVKVDLNEVEAVRRKFESTEKKGGKNPRDHFKEGDQIHSLIFEASQNGRLIEIYKRLQEHVERMRLYFFNQVHQERSVKSYEEHIEILDALAAHDPLRAENAIRNHLRNSIEFLKKII